MDMDRDVITKGGEGRDRLAIAGHDLHAGDAIEVKVLGNPAVPARVEWDSRLGWVAYVPQDYVPGDNGQILVVLRPGVHARWPKGR